MSVSPVPPHFADTLRCFQLPGPCRDPAPYGNGHIHDTFVVACDAGGAAPRRYLVQRINHQVFQDVPALMENVQRVTVHLARKGVAAGRRLALVPAAAGAFIARDPEGGWWRVYDFIERARSYDRVETPAQAREAARAFGEFQSLLTDLPGGRLRETIPGFHDTRRRFQAFARAQAADRANRAVSARAEIGFALAREADAGVLLGLFAAGRLPERVTHNDTKLNNVLLDAATGRAACVIDLDTVMPGLALYDFGDLVRTATSPAPEDERDLAKVALQPAMFRALAEGYLAAAGGFLTAAERAQLVFAGQLITFEIGLRFLTDYLEGDVYFKTHRPGHNLDRCRAQFALVRSIEAQQDALAGIVAETAARG